MPDNLKIMVVDDESDILSMITVILQKYDFQVDSFTNPIEALGHFERYANDYALVLSDIRMPGMTGIEFLNLIKRVRPNIPVLAMTAYAESDDEISNAVPSIIKEEILHKPFKLLDVCTAVKKQLKITS